MTSAIFGLLGSLSSPVAVLDGSSVRTSQGSFLPREEKHGGVSSVTWPRSGMLRNGRCYPLETSALRIVGRGFGSLRNLPTPTVGDSKNAANATSGRKPGSKHHAGTTLVDAIRTWPTARVHMTRGTREDRGRCNLEEVVHSQADARSAGAAPASPGAAIRRMRGTPAAAMWKGSGQFGSKSHAFDVATFRLKGQVMESDSPGQLNPDWVEWLMGYPIGFTACAASETPSSRKSSKPSRGKSGGRP